MLKYINGKIYQAGYQAKQLLYANKYILFITTQNMFYQLSVTYVKYFKRIFHRRSIRPDFPKFDQMIKYQIYCLNPFLVEPINFQHILVISINFSFEPQGFGRLMLVFMLVNVNYPLGEIKLCLDINCYSLPFSTCFNQLLSSPVCRYECLANSLLIQPDNID